MDLNIKNIFITGTDTGAGKSVFSSILALAFYNQGKKVCISKPIQTGFLKDSDTLKKLTGNKIPIFNIYSFSLPAAPVVSAEHENKKIEIKKVISDIKKLEKEFDCVIVEGIGGIAVPIIDNYLVADLIKDLNYPVVIVSRPSLGTINHTVLTIEFTKQKRLNLLGFVISPYDETLNDPVIKTAPDIISKLTQVQCLMKVPKIKELSFKSINSISQAIVASSSSKAPSSLAKEYPILL